MKYHTVIGLEIHVELLTQTKIFCACSAKFGGEPNHHTCPICLGMPGALPVLNKKAVELAVCVGLATNCEIQKKSMFDRKNYFYPDNPQNYQISQLYLPICKNGWLDLENSESKRIRIHEIHLEEDASKLIHGENGTLIDYNRAGVPLIEIVTEPDFSNSDEVIQFLRQLQDRIVFLNASDCKMNEGSMRVDVNLSLRREGETRLGTRTEMKNLNSFKGIEHGIAHERTRQLELLQSGQSVKQETRRWKEEQGCSFSMRTKETVRDYRYFPDPDLMPIVLSEQWIEKIRASLPEFKEELSRRLQMEYGITKQDAEMLSSSPKLANLFEETNRICYNPKKTANWLTGELFYLLKASNRTLEECTFSVKNVAELVRITDRGEINSSAAKEVFKQIFFFDCNPNEYIAAHRLSNPMEEGQLTDLIQSVIFEHTKATEDYRKGKKQAIGFLLGQIMKQLHGRGDPTRIKNILTALLEKQDE